MTLYYRLDRKEVVDTVTVIPKSMWKKKSVLPYILNSVITSDKTLKDNIKINLNDVVETKYVYQKAKTFLEIQTERIGGLKQLALMDSYTKYPQFKRDAALATKIGINMMTTLEADTIIKALAKIKNDVNVLEVKMLATKTIKELDLLPKSVVV